MRPADTTTAFICRVAEATTFGVDIAHWEYNWREVKWLRCLELEMLEVWIGFWDVVLML